MNEKTDPKVTINALPTKDFFISMLVKDIGLIRAILDLVDNSVDGARRIRKNGDYNGLTVRIETEKEQFKIVDNCGGISVELARDYAFRFGRPEGMPTIPHFIGQFGVGMKRALFKLGRKFKIESKASNSSFVIEEDVDKWRNKEEWEFEFEEIKENLSNPEDQCETIITVASLHKGVSDEFGLENFQNRLNAELEAAHQDSVEKGLVISLNQRPLNFRPAELLHSDQLQPANKEITYNEAAPPIKVRIYAGIAESNPSAAGWYIFCNGRMVLKADQTITTGWGEGVETTIPKYHNQFSRFQGYVFFDSDDAGRLPWNTTKTGVDGDSPIFRAVRLEMINIMRPVIDFLNKLDAEMDKDEKPLETVLERAKATKLSEVNKSDVFIAPKSKVVITEPRLSRIQYSKLVDEVERVKERLKVTTNKEVGEKTFEYFFKKECED